jgi:hypothetical protein
MFAHYARLRSSKIPKSAPGEWSETQALRECAVLVYPDDHASILREIFPALYTFYLEEHLYVDRTYCGSSIKGQLRAVMLDLRYTARFLAMVARQSLDEQRESDQQLGELADRLAVHVERLADLVEKKIIPKRRKRTRADEQLG